MYADLLIFPRFRRLPLLRYMLRQLRNLMAHPSTSSSNTWIQADVRFKVTKVLGCTRLP